jgi:sulfite reductase (NADPH) flavoprotein alpha-component
MTSFAPILPETAPFTGSERAWINGWLAGFYADTVALGDPAPAAAAVVADHPWHDMTLPLDERLRLSEDRPLAERLMSAMAQQDCGQCSYLCETYAAALANGAEKNPARCVPGGKETARTVREMLEIGSTGISIPALPAANPTPAPVARNALARLETAAPLNRPGSQKDTRHVVFDLAGTGLDYEVGDALGVQPENCPETVAAIIECLGARPGDEIDCPDGTRRTLAEALGKFCDISRVADAAIEVLATRAPHYDESQRLQALAEGYPGAGPVDADLLELLQTFPSARPPAQELVAALSPLQPRLYSISSSPKTVGAEAHLTVATVRYDIRGRPRKGVASSYLADRCPSGSMVPVFVQKTQEFRPPQDDTAPMVMIGPGTGVAPFRAFLQERQARGARGRNWLFFGDQRRDYDFLYGEELNRFRGDGLLNELDLAFSRDQPQRVYVQQRMRERARDLWGWIEDGAHIFVCGAVAMARDVDAAIAAIIARQGGMGPGAAKAYLAKLARAKRYLRDVY